MALVAATIWAGGRRAFALAGVLAGLAAATRYTAGLAIVLPLVLALHGEGRRRRVLALAAGSIVAFGGVLALAGHPQQYVQGLAFLGGPAGPQYRPPLGLV